MLGSPAEWIAGLVLRVPGQRCNPVGKLHPPYQQHERVLINRIRLLVHLQAWQEPEQRPLAQAAAVEAHRQPRAPVCAVGLCWACLRHVWRCFQ